MTTQTAAAQQCFRSRPLLKEKGSVVSVFSHMARQECAHGISLNERVGVSPTMPPLLQRLLTIRIRLRIVLRHLQLIGIEFDHLAAGTFSLTFEMLYKLTHSPPVCRPSEAALKRPVIVFLNFDRAADLQQIVHKLTVVAFAGGRKAPMVLGKNDRHPASAIARVPTLKSSKAPTNYFTPNILRKSWSRLVVSVVHWMHWHSPLRRRSRHNGTSPKFE